MIPVKFVIAPAVGMLYSIYRLRKLNKALAAGNHVIYAALTTRTDQLKYLADLCEQHGVPLNDFDMIILTQQF